MMEFEDIKKELNAYLDKQKKHFGVNVKYVGKDKKRFQIEIPVTQSKKAGSGYELQGSRKGFERFATAETKVCAFFQMSAATIFVSILKVSVR